MAPKPAKSSKPASDVAKFQRIPAWDRLDPTSEKLLETRAKGYLSFLRQCKTERETISFIETEATAVGFKTLAPFGQGKPLKPGTRVLFINKNRAMGLAIIGKRPPKDGFRLVAAHHDVPHLDLKSLPLYEKHGLALLKTHYYGGIKKFHWGALPLSLHGFAITRAGKTFRFVIGEDPQDPVFTITDVPPHLSYQVQNDRKAVDVFKGEELNILVGSRPSKGADTAGKTTKDTQKAKESKDAKANDRVKTAVLEHLLKTFGLEEEDLAWAEVAAVPALDPREVGFDRSMIGAFGHDDRACVMAAFEALKAVKIPEYTAAILLFDKEEIGSAGASGAQSLMVSDFLGMLVEAGGEQPTYPAIRRAIAETLVLSADTNAPIDPTFEAAWDAGNAGMLGHGVWITKFTGSRGKTGSSEADVEFVARVRSLFTKANIPYQFGEMGKVDEGGGGTVARFLAELNMHVLDLGLPTLSLHSPFEVLSKVDYHYTVSAYQAFLEQDC